MKIESIMTRKVVSASPSENFSGVIEKLSRGNITGMPVVSRGKVIGVVTQSDIIKNMDMFSRINGASDISSISRLLKGRDVSREEVKKAGCRKVKDFMSRKVVTIGIGSTVYDAAKLINENGVDRLPVVKSGRLVGIVTKKDIIKAMEKMNA